MENEFETQVVEFEMDEEVVIEIDDLSIPMADRC
jgi:hypothetical protein